VRKTHSQKRLREHLKIFKVQNKNPKKLYKERRTLPIFFAFFSPSWGDSGALVVGRGGGSFVEDTKIGRRNGSNFLPQY
jgi:hypothetical protein